jgi:hypothetical protein
MASLGYDTASSTLHIQGTATSAFATAVSRGIIIGVIILKPSFNRLGPLITFNKALVVLVVSKSPF